MEILRATCSFLQNLKVNPKVGILTAVRKETYERKKNSDDFIQRELNKTYEDAEWLVQKLKEKYEVFNHEIEINTAVENGCNVILPINGIVGNQIFRVFFMCGYKNLFNPRIGLSRYYTENTRNETDFTNHIRWLVAWISGFQVIK